MNIVPVITDSQIKTVAALAAEIWTEHFTPIIGADQVRYMLDNIQSVGAITESIRHKQYQYFLMVDDNGPLGYFACHVDSEGLFLSKLYICKSSRGKGYSKIAVSHLEQIAKDSNANKIWLTVNKNNSNVISIYQKMGFVIDAPLVQDIGGGFIMDDYKMVKKI